jgi:hypothetical protein
MVLAMGSAPGPSYSRPRFRGQMAAVQGSCPLDPPFGWKQNRPVAWVMPNVAAAYSTSPGTRVHGSEQLDLVHELPLLVPHAGDADTTAVLMQPTDAGDRD